MAKKKKEPVVIDPTELKPTTIGKLETKENGPWVVIIIIALLLVGIFFLDDIREFINNGGLSNISTSKPQTSTPSKPEEEQKEEPQETEHYQFLDTVVAKIEDFEFTGITLNNHTLTFQIENKGSTNNYFVNHNYYVELYNEENTLLERVKIDNINISSKHTFTYEVNASHVAYFTLRLMTESDYPAIVLKKENGNPYLQCYKENQTYTYYFDDNNELTSLEYILRMDVSEEEYETLFDDYVDRVNKNNNINGVESDAYPSETGFEYYVNIALNTIPNTTYQSQFKEKEYYANHTSARLISFELESSGYTCE